MRRPSLLLALVIGCGLIVAACASPVSAPDEPAEGEPTPQAADTEAPESEAPDATDAGDDQRGSGGDETEGEGGAPALADGPWTAGQAHITVSGAVSLTIDEQLTADMSETEQAKTQLIYNTDREFVTLFINFTGVPFHIGITADDFSVSGEPGCEVTYALADDNGIEGTFSCPKDEFYWYSVEEEPTGEITIEGSFTATR